MNDQHQTESELLRDNPAFPKKRYAALIFDCDGTLTDSMAAHFVAWKQTMDRHGIVFSEDRFYSLAGMPTQNIIELLSREQGVDVDAVVVAHEKESAFVENISLLVPVAPVLEVARYFRGRLPIAVASGGHREIIDQQLRQIGCGDWFDATVTAEDTVRHKPEPDVFLKAAELMNVPAHQCLVYEDASLGLEAARAAGMDAIDVRTFHIPRRVTLSNGQGTNVK